ncbi:hypothetical protein V1507DRAFT_39742 [Lipomyces tetrasporus]
MTATPLPQSPEKWTVTGVGTTHLHVMFPLVGNSLRKFLQFSMANKLRSQSYKSNDVEGAFTSDVREGNRIAIGPDGKELDRDAAVSDASRIGQKRSGDADRILYANIPRQRGRPPKHPKLPPVYGESVLQFAHTFAPPVGSQNNTIEDPSPHTSDNASVSTSEIPAAPPSQLSVDELKDLSAEFRMRRTLSVRSLTNPLSGNISAVFVASERQTLFANKYRELFIIDTRSTFNISDTEVVGLNIIGIDHEMRSFSVGTALFYNNEPRKPYLWILRQFRSVLFSGARISVFPESLSRICKTQIYASLTEYLASIRSFLIEDKIAEFESGILALGSTTDKKEYINQLRSLRRAFKGSVLWNEFAREYMSGLETAWMDFFDAELRTFGMKTTARCEAFVKNLRQKLEVEFTLESDISKLQRVLKVMHKEVFDIPDFIEQDNKLLRYRATLQIHYKLYPVKFRVSQFALLKMTGELRTLEDADGNEPGNMDKGHCKCTLPAQFGLPCYHDLQYLDEVNLSMIDKRWHVPAFTDAQLRQQSYTPINRKRLLANEELSLDNQIVFDPTATKTARSGTPVPNTAPIPALATPSQPKRRGRPPKPQTQAASVSLPSSLAPQASSATTTEAVQARASAPPVSANKGPAPNWPLPPMIAVTPSPAPEACSPTAPVASAQQDAEPTQSASEGTMGVFRNPSFKIVMESPAKKSTRACSSCGSIEHDSRMCGKRKEIQKLILS